MALTITRPKYWVISLSSNATGTFNFKYVVNLKDSSGGVITTFKLSKNPYGVAHIDFERAVKSYINVTNKHDNTITSSSQGASKILLRLTLRTPHENSLGF